GLVDFQPEDASLVGEDQHVAVGGGDQQMLDEILSAGAHADAAFAPARLAAVVVYAGALDIAAAGDGDGHVLFGDEVFETNLAGVFDDLGAALVGVVLLDFLELLDDQVLQDLFGA